MWRLARHWPSSAAQGRGSRVVHTLMKLHLSLPMWKENIIDSANNVNIGSRLHSVWAAVSAPTRLTNWRDCKLDVSSKYDCALFLRMIAGLVLGFPSVETKRQVGKKTNREWWCVWHWETILMFDGVFFLLTQLWRLVRLSHSQCRRRSIRHYSDQIRRCRDWPPCRVAVCHFMACLSDVIWQTLTSMPIQKIVVKCTSNQFCKPPLKNRRGAAMLLCYKAAGWLSSSTDY